jgi:tetratricopeptide (TPR) repeat protein
MKDFSIKYENRQVIPRWLPYRSSQIILNTATLPIEKPLDSEIINFNNLIQDWEKNKTISFAIQVAATADTLGLRDSKEYKDALEFIKKFNDKNNVFKGNALLHDFFDIDAITENCDITNVRNNIDPIAKIHELKGHLANNYDDAILWVDIAYFYFLLGNTYKAEKYIKTALSLNKYSPHIVRSAARFYLFLEDPEKALHIIRKTPNILHNPFILSAEIAISEAFDLKTRLAKKSFDLLYNKNISPYMLNELHATIATLEYNYGNLKNSKKHIDNVLKTPNENSIAQVQFINEKRNIIFDPRLYNTPCRHEADTYKYYQNFQYKEAAIESGKWHQFQPFSTKPTLLNSFILGTFFNKNEEALVALDTTLKLKPDTTSLLNNKAFSLAKLGKVKEAEDCIAKIPKDAHDADDATIKATRGLIEYRKNNPELGRTLYKEAIEICTREKDFPKLARALFFMYIEERRNNTTEAPILRTTIEDLAKKHDIKETQFLLSTLKDKS